MYLNNSAISKAIETATTGLNSSNSAIEAIIRSQKSFTSPFRSGTFSAITKISENLSKPLLNNSAMGLSNTLSLPRFFNPISSETLNVIAKITDIGKQHQKMSEAISLSLKGKETLLIECCSSSIDFDVSY